MKYYLKIETMDIAVVFTYLHFEKKSLQTNEDNAC